MKKTIFLSLILSLTLIHPAVRAEPEETLLTAAGIVVDIDLVRDTFNICPTDDSCPVTEENVFVVTEDTKMEGLRILGEMKVGDRIEVTGKPLNEVVWVAKKIIRGRHA